MAAIKGGDKLAIALAKIAAGVSKPGTLSVGFLEGATAPNGDSIPERAANNEFGTPNAEHPIPPRPFFRNMIAAKSPEWPAAVGNLLKANDYDATKALDIAGEAIEGQLRQSIIDTNSPPLAEATIAAKGFSKPLIETSDMINAVSHIVKS
jgi:hypothetical protein